MQKTINIFKGGIMRKIFILSACLFFYGFIDGDDQLGPAKPIEIGIASLNAEKNYTLSI